MELSTEPRAKAVRAATALPSWLAALVNPDVLAERESLIAERLADLVGERVRRRRCAEVVAAHLLEVQEHGQIEEAVEDAA